MYGKLSSRKLSSESTSVLTKEALSDLDYSSFDLLEGWEPNPGHIYTFQEQMDLINEALGDDEVLGRLDLRGTHYEL